MSSDGYLPRYLGTSQLFQIGTPILLKVQIFLPLFGFFFSVFWSFFYDFQRTTWTHCQVTNYLPSISAAFNYPPSVYVWRICISFHGSMRLLNIFVYYHHNRTCNLQRNWLMRWRALLSVIAAIANFLEIVFLVCLTCISSGENKGLHVASFSMFVMCSVLYLSVTCLLHSASQKETSGQKTGWRWKWISWLTNVISLILAAYFYRRHNKYCERHMYTKFALCEYVFVLSNIAFHYALRFDFEDYHFCYEESSDAPEKATKWRH